MACARRERRRYGELRGERDCRAAGPMTRVLVPFASTAAQQRIEPGRHRFRSHRRRTCACARQRPGADRRTVRRADDEIVQHLAKRAPPARICALEGAASHRKESHVTRIEHAPGRCCGARDRARPRPLSSMKRECGLSDPRNTASSADLPSGIAAGSPPASGIPTASRTIRLGLTALGLVEQGLRCLGELGPRTGGTFVYRASCLRLSSEGRIFEDVDAVERPAVGRSARRATPFSSPTALTLQQRSPRFTPSTCIAAREWSCRTRGLPSTSRDQSGGTRPP
jgi:hypothetical protein